MSLLAFIKELKHDVAGSPISWAERVDRTSNPVACFGRAKLHLLHKHRPDHKKQKKNFYADSEYSSNFFVLDDLLDDDCRNKKMHHKLQ